MHIPIDLTNPSPAFAATCKTLLQMADTDGLGDGYAVFGPELGGEGRWYVVAAANQDQSYLLELRGMLDDVGVEVEGGRS
jgi:hypothetical protein